MWCHVLASLMLDEQAALAPLSTVCSRPRQSVSTLGTKGAALRSTWQSAHASAAEALSHHSGGTPLPQASKSPASEMTTMAKPSVLSPFHLGFIMDPSITQVVSVLWASGGGECHWKVS